MAAAELNYEKYMASKICRIALAKPERRCTKFVVRENMGLECGDRAGGRVVVADDKSAINLPIKCPRTYMVFFVT